MFSLFFVFIYLLIHKYLLSNYWEMTLWFYVYLIFLSVNFTFTIYMKFYITCWKNYEEFYKSHFITKKIHKL